MEETPEVFNSFFKDGKYEFQKYQNDLLFDYDGFFGRNLSASYAPKKMTKSIKVLFFSCQSYSKNTVRMEKLFSKTLREAI